VKVVAPSPRSFFPANSPSRACEKAPHSLALARRLSFVRRQKALFCSFRHLAGREAGRGHGRAGLGLPLLALLSAMDAKNARED